MPTMKNPAHPGALIKDDIEALGLSVAEAAAGLGVTRQQLYRVHQGGLGSLAGDGHSTRKSIGRSGRCMAAYAG